MGLYKALSGEGNPIYATVAKWRMRWAEDFGECWLIAELPQVLPR